VRTYFTAELILKNAVLAILAILFVTSSVQTAQAYLLPPLRGAAIKQNLTPEQQRRAMYFMALKTTMLQTGAEDATLAIQQVETTRNIVQTINNVAGLYSSAKEMSSTTTDSLYAIAQSSNVIVNTISPKIRSYMVKKGLYDSAELILVLTGHFLDVVSTEFPAVRENSAFQSYLTAIANNDANGIAAGLNNLFNSDNFLISWVANTTFAVTVDLVTNIPDLRGIGLEFKRAYYLIKWGNGIWNSLQLATVAQKSLPMSTVITNAISISIDLAAASVVSDISSQLKTKLIALEFLDYYYVTYGGNLDLFKANMGAGSSTDIDQLFSYFMQETDSIGQSMESLYGAVDWLDSLPFIGQSFDKTSAVELIRRIVSTTGPLALKIRYQGGPVDTDKLDVGDTTAYSVTFDPLTAMDFTPEAITIAEKLPNGATSNYSLGQQGGTFLPVSSLPGAHNFTVTYYLTDKATSQISPYTFSFEDTVLVPSTSVHMAPLTISNIGVTAASNGSYELSMQLSIPADFMTYNRTATVTNSAVSGSLPNPTNLRIRALSMTAAGSEYHSDWLDISSGSAMFRIPVTNAAALVAKSGVIGAFTFEVEATHPYCLLPVVGSFNSSISYNNLTVTPTTPYLEIQVPDKNIAAPIYKTFYAEQGSKVRLIPRNDLAWPDFNVLSAGQIEVFVIPQDGPYGFKRKVLFGILVNGAVEFVIGTAKDNDVLPSGRFEVVAVSATLQSGYKSYVAEIQQFVEIGTFNSTGNTPPSTTGAITLPRTGQYLCYDSVGAIIPCAGTGQDGEIQAGAKWPVPRFEDNGDETMTDKLTGLIWTKDANAPGPTVCVPGTTKTWANAMIHVECLNINQYLGKTDWRLPNRNELISLIDHQPSSNLVFNSQSVLSAQGFINIPGIDDYLSYWSSSKSSTYTGDNYHAWYINLNNGNNGLGLVQNAWDSGEGHVWPVRGGQSYSSYPSPVLKTGQTVSYYGADDGVLQAGAPPPVQRFNDNGDGTVTDNLTGLVWLKNASCSDTSGGIANPSGKLSRTNALAWSNGLSSAVCGLNDSSASGDWRLPNATELLSLVDISRVDPAIPNGHPFTSVQDVYWSSSASFVYIFGDSGYGVSMVYGSTFRTLYQQDDWGVWPVRGGKIDSSTRIFPPQTTFISENLPDGSYQVGQAIKAWRFKSAENAISNLKAVLISSDSGLGINQTEITIGDVASNTEFLVYLPINPVHDATSLKSSYWKLVDGNGIPVTITNSKTGQFWLKIQTNRPPVFSQLQLVSVGGAPDPAIVSLPLLATDPDGDTLSLNNYSVVSGGGNIVSGTWQGKPAILYQNSFPSSIQTVFPVEVQVSDGHGGTTRFTIQAVIAPDSKIKEFYKDTPYPVGGDPETICNPARTPVFTPNIDQYQAIHHLTMKGILIGTPDQLEPTKRNFDGCSVASQAEVLATLMKAAITRGIPKGLALDVEPRWLPNLVITDVENGIFENYSWAVPYVLKAEALGIIPSAETFDPSQDATREWTASLVARMLQLSTPMDAVDQATYLFADSGAFSNITANSEALAAAYFGYMVAQYGSTVYFRPIDPLIRADMAIVASKILCTPTAEAIETTGLTMQSLFGNQMLSTTHGQAFNVTGITNLTAFMTVVDYDGYVSESIISPSIYTTAKIIRPGNGEVGSTLVTNLANSSIIVPTATPDISFSEKRSIIAVLESTDNPVRNVVRLDYGVIFPDRDGDGVSDALDLWPDNPLYDYDANGNGIPDNADSLWGLTNRNGSEQIKISGQVMTLQNAVLSGQYAQMMNDTLPPTVVSALPATGSQELPLTQAITITFSRELDASTVASGTVILTNTTTSAAVVGTISYNLGVLSFTPTSALSYANDYQFRLTTGIKDLAGHSLASDFLLTFKTEPQNFPPPTGTISINGGALFTATPVVTLAITATDPDGVPWMCISQTGSCPGWIPFSTTSTYTITGSAGVKTLSIWFSDGKSLANSTPAATASITYDNIAPTLTLSMLADGAVTRENQITVTGVARDNVGGSGITSVTVNGKSVEFNSCHRRSGRQ